MKLRYGRSFLGVLCLVLGLMAQAKAQPGDAQAAVDGVQMPAWVERNGMRTPLAQGQFLQNRDKLFTGADARLRVRLADGSAVGLGENTELHLNALGLRDDSVFTGALELVQGVFRLTTGNSQEPRAINVRISTMTAGVRAADIWGRADERGALFCLLQGSAAVVQAKDEMRTISDASACYTTSRGGMLKQVGDMSAEQVWKGALETQMQDGPGFAQRGGSASAVVATVDSEAEALALHDRIRAAGYAVSIRPRQATAGGYLYIVSVAQLPTQSDARAVAARFNKSIKPEM